MDFFNKYEIIYKHHFGFWRGEFTEHAVLDLLYNISSSGNKRQGLFNFSGFCKGIARKRVRAPLLFLRHPPLDPACPPSF